MLCYGLARVRREPGGVGDGAGALCGGGGEAAAGRALPGRLQRCCAGRLGAARLPPVRCGTAAPGKADAFIDIKLCSALRAHAVI